MNGLIANFVTVVLGSGAAIAITRLVFDYRREKRQRNDATKFLAVRLAFHLEAYAVECAGQSSDHDTAIEHQGHAGQLIGAVPQPGPFPESDAYQYLAGALLNEVLDFPQRCKMAQRAAMFWWDMLGDKDATDGAMGENTVRMGSLALDIARRIRQAHRLGPRDLTFGQWNIDEYFSGALKKVAAREKREAENQPSIEAG
jgi:hypothetical protein